MPAVLLAAGLISCAKQIKEDEFVSDPQLQEGLFAELRGEYEKAEEIFRSSPDKFWGKLLLADLYFYRKRDYKSALKEVEDVERSINKKSPKAEPVLYRKGLLLQSMGKYAEAGKIYEYVAVTFPNGAYFEDATDAVEEMFRRNFPETLATYDGGYVSAMMLEWALEKIPPFQRNRFDNPEGRKKLVERLAIEEVAFREAQRMHLDTTKEVKEKMEIERKAALRQAYYTYGVKAKAAPSEKEMRAYYNTHKSYYREAARLELIRVALKDSAKAYEILKEVKGGAKLDSIAADTTINLFKAEATRRGKLIIYDTYGAYKQLFEEAFKHDTGDVFVFHQDTIWMVVKVLSKKPERYRTYDEVKNNVKNALQGERERKIYEEDRKRLMKFYGVKILISVSDSDTVPINPEEREEGPSKEEMDRFRKELPDTVAIIEKLGKVITASELIDRIKRVERRYQRMYMTPKGAKEFLENAMLPEILEVADAEFHRYYLHYPIYSRLQSAYKDAMLLALYNKLVKEKVKVDEEEIKKYYETHKDEFVQEGRLRVQRIVVKDRRTAYRILRLLRKGKVNPDSLAKAVTEIKAERRTSGYVNITERNEPDFYRKAMRAPLKKWRVTRLKDGRWVVYRVLQKIKKRQLPYEEVRNTIFQRLAYEKEKKLYEEALENLKKKYHVVIYEDRINPPKKDNGDKEKK